MKKSLPLIGVLSIAVTGCGSGNGFMYGDHRAPVTNQNAYYGQQPAPAMPVLTPAQTAIQANGGHAGLHDGQQMANTGNGYLRPVRPPERIEVNEPSPYRPADTVAANGEGDGWSIRPDPNAAPEIVDTPKVDNTGTAAAQGGDAKPIRPATSRTDENNATAQAGNNQDSGRTPAADSENSQVASATPPGKSSSQASGQSATAVLLKQASAALGKGDLDGAVAYLRDAERIDPNNVKIQYDIANIRYHQGRYGEAESAASRAINTGGSNAMMKKTWSLIANARKALGDNQGAITAAERAASY